MNGGGAGQGAKADGTLHCPASRNSRKLNSKSQMHIMSKININSNKNVYKTNKEEMN